MAVDARGESAAPVIVAVMGVAGSGKTTVGTMLAEALHCAFLDGDSLHSDANVEAMENGRPLTDAERAPWLAAIRSQLLDAVHRGDSLVVACSALKQSYRDVLDRDIPIVWVYLKGEPTLIRVRLNRRTGHFMKSDLLASQLAELEEPSDAIVMDVSQSPDAIVTGIAAALREKPDVRILPDLDALSLRAAQAAVGIINDTVRRTGRCSLVLSGGGTPIPMYRLLASTFRDSIPWPSVHVFWGDERYLPHDAPQSNYRMAKAILLDHVPCPAVNIHPMPTHFGDPAAAAYDYEATLTRYWAGGERRLDLVLLGMGPDGHTASLFPGAPALHERDRWVVAATVRAEPSIRLTLTLPAFARSIEAHFLVAGHDKAHALEQVLSGSADPTVYPAAGVRPLQGKVIWWVDRDATRKEE